MDVEEEEEEEGMLNEYMHVARFMQRIKTQLVCVCVCVRVCVSTDATEREKERERYLSASLNDKV